MATKDNNPILKLHELRRGNPKFSRVYLGDENDGVEVAVVILTADDVLDIDEQVQVYCSSAPNKINDIVRSEIANAMICQRAIRNPDNLDEKLLDSLKQTLEMLDLEDMGRIIKAYNELMINRAPKLETLSSEDLEEIKKKLKTAKLKDLNIVQRLHLTSFLQAMRSEG